MPIGLEHDGRGRAGGQRLERRSGGERAVAHGHAEVAVADRRVEVAQLVTRRGDTWQGGDEQGAQLVAGHRTPPVIAGRTASSRARRASRVRSIVEAHDRQRRAGHLEARRELADERPVDFDVTSHEPSVHPSVQDVQLLERRRAEAVDEDGHRGRHAASARSVGDRVEQGVGDLVGRSPAVRAGRRARRGCRSRSPSRRRRARRSACRPRAGSSATARRPSIACWPAHDASRRRPRRATRRPRPPRPRTL